MAYLNSFLFFCVLIFVILVQGLSKESEKDELILLAKSKIGSPYVYAASGPDQFDCSGFVYYVFKQKAEAISRTSLAQSKQGKQLNRKELRRGDILFLTQQSEVTLIIAQYIWVMENLYMLVRVKQRVLLYLN
ncbi:MAG: hypothetical protein DRQ45_07445 [Gammaproteobacteria bacterium]|nr:MAG: hypothetical protein DRQ45_07445 [Gammaproteobacteria bacterium]